MENNKLLVWLMAILIIPLAFALNQNQFTNGLNIENISFSNNTIQRFIQLPLYVNASNGSLIINYLTLSKNATSIEKTESSLGAVTNERYMSDDDILTYGQFNAGSSASAKFTFNHSTIYAKKILKYNLSDGTLPQYDRSNTTNIIDNCTTGSNITILLNASAISGNLDFYCYNHSNSLQKWKFFYYVPLTFNEYTIFEIQLIQLVDSANFSLDFGDNDKIYEASYIGLSNTTNINLEFTSKLNTLGGCTCTNCSISGAYCNYPIYLYYNNTGVLEVSPNITYSYLFELNNCSRGLPALNVSFKYMDETKATINYSVTSTYSFNGVSQFYNETKYSATNLSVCVYPNYLNVTGDLSIYYNLGSSAYAYSSSSLDYSNVTKFLSLYVSEGATLVLLNVKNNLNINLQNVYIQILQFDPATSTYKTVGTVMTDSSGNAVAPFTLNTVWYKFILTYNGIVELTDGPSLIISTSKNFRITPSTSDFIPTFDDFQNINGSVTYNNVTHNVVFSYADPSLSITKGCLSLYKSNRTVWEYLVNYTCSADSTTSIVVQVTDRGNASYYAKGAIVIDDTWYNVDYEYFSFGGALAGITTAKKTDMLFYSGILILAVVFGLITTSPVIAIIVMMALLDLFTMAKFVSANAGIIISLNILAGIVIWRMSKAQ